MLSACWHIQREASVVRSTMMGNSRASNCKDGQESTALRFSFYSSTPMRQARRQLKDLRKMRIQTLILSLLFCIASAFAKDVITKTDGSKIDAKVEEITETVIKYRKASNPTGSVYSISLESVVNIIYENGIMDTFNMSNDIQQSDMKTFNSPSDDDLIRISGYSDKEAISSSVSDTQLLKIANLYTSDEILIKKAKKYRLIGWIGGGVCLATGIIVGLVLYQNDYYIEDYLDLPFIVGGGCAIAGAAWCLGFNLKANSLMKQARDMQSYSATIFENEILQIGDYSLTTGINVMGNRNINSHSLGVSLGLNF